jgi:hypothetical protein
MAAAAYSCDRTAATLLPRLGSGWRCGGGVAPALDGDGLKIYHILAITRSSLIFGPFLIRLYTAFSL